MKNPLNKLIILGTVASIFAFSGCGKRSKGDGPPSFIDALAQASDAMGYGIKVLGSYSRTPPSASLAQTIIQEYEASSYVSSAQDPDLPDCSNDGEPWDKTTGQRMSTSNSKYSETVFFCQVNSKQSLDTIVGSLNQNKAILCDLERVIGSITYTEEGTEYKDRSITITEECGWSKKSLQDMNGKAMIANLTAYAINSGDWQKRVNVKISDRKIDFDLFFSIRSDFVGFKFIEKWDQTSKTQSGDYNSNISSTATGTRGAVVTIDPSAGILRAESIDTYWSRRFRFFIQGTLDNVSGVFNYISDGQGIVANFDHQTGLYADIATMTGNDNFGFTHGTYAYTTSNISSVRSSSTLSSAIITCSKTGGCQGQSAIAFSMTVNDFDFLMIGAAWDGQLGKRSASESWLSTAGALTYSSVSKATTP